MLERVIAFVVAELRSIPGLYTVPDYPEEQAHGGWPLAVVYPESGKYRYGSASGARGMPDRWGVHTIGIRVHVPRKDLAHDMARILPFSYHVPERLFTAWNRDRWGGIIIAMGDVTEPGATAPLRYEFGADRYGDTDTIAYRFALDVTVGETVEEEL